MIKSDKIERVAFYCIVVLFILGALFIWQQHVSFWFFGLPVGLALLWLGIERPKKLLELAVLLLPFSVSMQHFFPSMPVDLRVPSEGIIIGFMLLFFMHRVARVPLPRREYAHPITVMLLVYLGWFGLTSLTSSLPVVSIKSFISTLWLVVFGYFIMLAYFKEQAGGIRRIWNLFIWGVVVTVVITMAKHVHIGLMDRQASYHVPKPFYDDHTLYGAVLALVLPYAVLGIYRAWSINKRNVMWALLPPVIVFIGLVFSYSRASWLSVAGAAAFGIMLFFRLKGRYFLMMILGVLTLLFVNQSQIKMKMAGNKTESSSDFEEHVSSISNVSTDASNVERINRWYCALQMAKEKPFVGWGPNTYQFQYAPFQIQKYRTIISTNTGDWGGPHSEYLGALAELGIPGFLIFMGLMGTIFFTGIQLVYSLADGSDRWLALAALLSLVGYFIHAFLNRFLDIPTAAIPFWMNVSILVLLDKRRRLNSSVGF